MTDTPSGNRWEPTEDDATQPLTPTPHTTPPTEPPTAADPVTEPVTPPEYGWAPVPQPAEAGAPRRGRRRTGALAAGAAALVLGAAVGGYAIGTGTAGSGQGDVGTTRQAPPDGFSPGPGFPDRDGASDDHDQFDGADGSDDGNTDDENS